MDDDLDLRNFSYLCRLFPLPKVVMFPHAVLPLHVFEPRYRQMTEDALADDQLVTIVQLRTAAAGTSDTLGSPPIEKIACLGRIVRHEALPDGRFNFLLLGRKRVRLKREIPQGKLYRVAEVEILEDTPDDAPDEPRRTEIITLFRRVFETYGPLDPDLALVLDASLPLTTLTDIVAHALGLPPHIKQSLLAETRVGRRAECLLSILKQITRTTPEGDAAGRLFPPPFSAN